MGLDVSHDAFSAAYSAFNRFRSAMGVAAGVQWPTGIGGDNFIGFPKGYAESHPGLYEFFTHSDCDGEIAPDLCAKLADEMESLLPVIDTMGHDWGHIGRAGGFGAVTRQFIKGCREAAAANEPLEFG